MKGTGTETRVLGSGTRCFGCGGGKSESTYSWNGFVDKKIREMACVLLLRSGFPNSRQKKRGRFLPSSFLITCDFSVEW